LIFEVEVKDECIVKIIMEIYLEETKINEYDMEFYINKLSLNLITGEYKNEIKKYVIRNYCYYFNFCKL
jgi:hypothetical protein